ncbi:MAG: hypothetical protein ACRDY1_03850, partial [Acidimicrobiales bacterium]
MRRGGLRALARLVAAGVAAAAVGRLTVGAGAWRGVVVAAVIGTAVTAGARRRMTASWSLSLGAVAVAVAAVWVSEPAGRWHGLPSPASLRHLAQALRTVGAFHFPMAGTAGVVVTAALLAGMLSV